MKKIKINDFADFILWDKLGDFSFGEKFTSARIKFESKKEDWEVLRTMISLDTTTVYGYKGDDKSPVPKGVVLLLNLIKAKINENGCVEINEYQFIGDSDSFNEYRLNGQISSFKIIELEEGYELDMRDESIKEYLKISKTETKE